MQQVLPALATLVMMGACIYWMWRKHQKDAKREQKGPWCL